MWNIPFGTRVRVVNKANGRTIDCIVTDRSPARRLVNKGRIIDLNYSAMAALGGIERGIIPVSITIGD
jgi:rare lipoprotein A (peptidoglycan hydrolase)